MRIRPGDGVVVTTGRDAGDRPLRAHSTGRSSPTARRLAQDPLLGVTLWRLHGPLVSTTRIDGLYPNDTWSGRTVTYTRTHCRRRQRRGAALERPEPVPEPQLVTATTTSGGRGADAAIRVPPAGSVASASASHADAKGVCVVRYTVSPTAVPADVIPGNTDDRVLGAHFNGFALEAA